MIGRTNAGTTGGNAVVIFNAAYGSTISWTGTDEGTVTLGTDASTISVQIKRGTYVFANTLYVDGATRTIYTKTVTVGRGATVVNMYPDGAVYWYGLPIVSEIVKAGAGNATKNRNSVSADYTRAHSYYKLTMTKTITPYNTTGKTKMHVVYKDNGSSSGVINTRFGAQNSAIGDEGAGSYNSGDSKTFDECIVQLGNLAGQELYFYSAYNAYDTYSGGGVCKHVIYAVWFD